MKTVEDRLETLEHSLRWYRKIAIVLALMVIGIVTMGQAGLNESDVIRCKSLEIVNETGTAVAMLTSHEGDGMLIVHNKDGKVIFGVTTNFTGDGMLTVSNKDGKTIFSAFPNFTGDGMLAVMNKDGKNIIIATGGNNGATVDLYNKTGEVVIQLSADDYGNGVVGAFNRKGKGRTLQPGP